MAAIISQAQVAINSSYSEGQPQAILEAMYLGLPCLLSAVPGNLGLITEAHEGYYFTSAQELADKALFIMHNENQRRMMGEAAQDLVQLRHHPRQEIDAYLNLYQEILKEFI
jgi:glycosyltransferase involved in cell wall biosynthesis